MSWQCWYRLYFSRLIELQNGRFRLRLVCQICRFEFWITSDALRFETNLFQTSEFKFLKNETVRINFFLCLLCIIISMVKFFYYRGQLAPPCLSKFWDGRGGPVGLICPDDCFLMTALFRQNPAFIKFLIFRVWKKNAMKVQYIRQNFSTSENREKSNFFLLELSWNKKCQGFFSFKKI